MTTVHQLTSALVLCALCSTAVRAQEPLPGPPCKGSPCTVIVDWGVGRSGADMPPDRKFGSPADFDAAMRAVLTAHGMQGAATDIGSALAVRVQAAYKTRVLCEQMPGGMPDRSCATIGEAIIGFASTDKGAKLPAAIRLINRCGASDAVMSMGQFGRYVGEMIWYTLEGEQQKANKPSGKC